MTLRRNYVDMMRYPNVPAPPLSASSCEFSPGGGRFAAAGWNSQQHQHHHPQSHQLSHYGPEVMFRKLNSNSNAYDSPKWTSSDCISSEVNNKNSNNNNNPGNYKMYQSINDVGYHQHQYGSPQLQADGGMIRNKDSNFVSFSSPSLDLLSFQLDELSWPDTFIQPLENGGAPPVTVETDVKETPDDDRLVYILLQLGIHRWPVLPDLRLHENELDLYTVHHQ